MFRAKVLVPCILAGAVVVYAVIRSSDTEIALPNAVHFPQKLSAFHLFEGNPSDLVPARGTELFELLSPLFTDYAEKQRLIRLPPGTHLTARGSGLPHFPEGTLIAKTFYYSRNTDRPESGKRIIETRLLWRKNSVWNAATYRWNDLQTEAFLLTESQTITVRRSLPGGGSEKIRYHIPSREECSRCHRLGNLLIPLGPKLRNLNVRVFREGKKISQLEYFARKGWLHVRDLSDIKTLPAYADRSAATESRARAYLDVHCAHCHNPSGFAAGKSLDLRFETPYEKSGIGYNRGNIASRIEAEGELHMPQIGTSVNDREGIRLLKKYLTSLSQK